MSRQYKSSNDGRRMAKKLPSGSGLPACWHVEMDRDIARWEGEGNLDVTTMIKQLHLDYEVLKTVSLVIPHQRNHSRSFG